MMGKNPKNILIIKPSSLGDIILALPTLSALRTGFPDAEISWLIRPEFAPVLQDHPHLDQIILFDRRFLGKAWYNRRAFASLISLICRIRRSKFDAVIDLQGLFRTACLSWLSGCKKRYGMTTAREFANIFYTNKVSYNTDCVHVVDYYLKVIKTIGVPDISVQFLLPENKTASDSVNRLLKTHNIKAEAFVVFVPGSAHGDKCWPIERFAALADRLSEQFGLSIIATGSSSERNIIKSMKSFTNVPVINLAGQTDLHELTELMRIARLVVSNDTGPGHIAAALGTPLVMIFGRSNPARVAPYKRKNCVVAIDPQNRGLKLNSDDSRYDIKAISVEQVYQKACEQIER